MKKLKGVMSISRLIGAIIVAVVLGALIGTVADSTIGYATRNDTNVTGTPTGILIALVPLFLVIGVVVSFITDV